MPRVKAPDGSILEVEGNTPEEILANARAQYAQHKQTQNNAAAETPKPNAPSGFARGLTDPFKGAAQLLMKAMPNSLNEALFPAGGYDRYIRENEAAYEQARQAAGKSGFDWGRLGGNIASPINLIPASRIAQAATLPGRIATGAVTGAAMSAMAPATGEGDYWQQKVKQAKTGALVGSAIPVATGALARIIKPQTPPQVEQVMREGVTPTPAQIMNWPWLKGWEERARSLPITGDAISSAQRKTHEEFIRGTYKQALAPIKGKVPAQVGNEGIESVHSQIGNFYDQVLSKASFKPDYPFVQDLKRLRTLATNLPQQEAEQFERVLQNSLLKKATPAGLMNGARLQEVNSDLGYLTRNYQQEDAFDKRQLGDALEELQNVLRQAVRRQNPAHAKNLDAADAAWARYVRIRRASAAPGVKEGRFTPAQLGRAVRQEDNSFAKTATSEGRALMQDWSNAGEAVLSQTVPDSGTAGRLMLDAGVLGLGATFRPDLLVKAGASTLPYLPGGRQTMATLLARRPAVAAPIAAGMRPLGTLLTPGIAQFNATDRNP